MTATTTRPLDYAEQTRRESDLRDWKQAVRSYQSRADAGEVLDAEQLDDWMFCRKLLAYNTNAQSSTPNNWTTGCSACFPSTMTTSSRQG